MRIAPTHLVLHEFADRPEAPGQAVLLGLRRDEDGKYTW
jgi:hypothetical protein